MSSLSPEAREKLLDDPDSDAAAAAGLAAVVAKGERVGVGLQVLGPYAPLPRAARAASPRRLGEITPKIVRRLAAWPNPLVSRAYLTIDAGTKGGGMRGGGGSRGSVGMHGVGACEERGLRPLRRPLPCCELLQRLLDIYSPATAFLELRIHLFGSLCFLCDLAQGGEGARAGEFEVYVGFERKTPNAG